MQKKMARAGTIASEKQKIFFMDLSLAQILLFKELIELKKSKYDKKDTPCLSAPNIETLLIDLNLRKKK